MSQYDIDIICVGFVLDLVISWTSNVCFSFYHTFVR